MGSETSCRNEVSEVIGEKAVRSAQAELERQLQGVRVYFRVEDSKFGSRAFFFS
jgi:hypothetical protein